MRKWLIEKREKQNLTQEKVAKKSGIQRSYYSMIENGKRSPSPYVAMKIATALCFDWTIFFNQQSNEMTHREVPK
ncbi:helix-turn-helix transcriptional regulator [Enterococcus hirae]